MTESEDTGSIEHEVKIEGRGRRGDTGREVGRGIGNDGDETIGMKERQEVEVLMIRNGDIEARALIAIEGDQKGRSGEDILIDLEEAVPPRCGSEGNGGIETEL